MSKTILYGSLFSPPVRACLFTLKALEIPYEYKEVNLFNGEHMTPEYLKHNPQHTIPVLEDEGIWLWDSHAICAYLVGKYGKTDSLYPKDLVKRAMVDQRMYFEASVLFMSLRNITAPLFRNNVTVVPKEKTENILEGYDFVEKFLGDNLYITGDSLTIADFFCCATISSGNVFIEIDIEKFPKIHAWWDRMKELPYYEEANVEGLNICKNFIIPKLTEVIL